jgi:hypothetical protein
MRLRSPLAVCMIFLRGRHAMFGHNPPLRRPALASVHARDLCASPLRFLFVSRLIMHTSCPTEPKHR